MSEHDRNKWNQRYAEGAYAERQNPSELLVQALTERQGKCAGQALDLACGAGRNALYLAEQGFSVTGIDVSDEALRLADAKARDRQLAVAWVNRDLDAVVDLEETYQFISMIRYVNPSLLSAAARAISEGGLLVVEEHLQTDAEVIGPRSPKFRVAPGELAKAATGLKIIHLFEGLTTDPDGLPVAVARMIASRPCEAT